jgi:glycosyltransferase involved in cell wall biosynthesis
MAASSRPAISICLPVFNGGRFLRQSLECIFAQTFGDFEVLISDDCSSDNTRQILEAHALSDKRVKYWLNDERLGLFANYNKCMQLASAPVIKLFAQDDLWHSQILEKQHKLLSERNDVVLVASRREVIDGTGARAQDCFQPVGLVDILGDKEVYRGRDVIRACIDPLINLIGEPSTVMFRSTSRGSGFHTIFKHIGDLEYWLRILSEGDFGLINEPLTSFRSHEYSATAYNHRQLWGIVDILHMADAASGLLDQMSISKDEYIKDNLAIVAKYLAPMISGGDQGPEQVRVEEDYTKIDVATLRKTLFYALELVSESERRDLHAPSFLSPEQTGHMIKSLQNEVLIKNSEKILRGLLNTVSWHATRPLREINRISAGGLTLKFADRSQFSTESYLRQQRSYLRHLKTERIRILKSRSWKITRFLRKGFGKTNRISAPSEGLPKETLAQRTSFTSMQGQAAPSASESVVSEKQLSLQKKLRDQQAQKEALKEQERAIRMSIENDLERRIPKSGTFNLSRLYEYDLAIGAVVRNEARFLPEWLEYHSHLGVQKFFIFDNLSDDDTRTVLRPYVTEGLVEVFDWPMTFTDQPGYLSMQMGAYRRIVDMCADDVKWIGFIDLDEFIVPQEEDNLVEILADYEDVGGVSLNWMMFGTSEIEKLEDDQLVIESLTKRAPIDDAANHFVKTISRAERIRRCKDPHAMLYDIGYKQVNTRKMPMYSSMSSTVVDHRMRINHYWTRDESYFLDRKVQYVKERGDQLALAELERRHRDFNAVEDTAIQRFVTPVKEKLARRRATILENSKSEVLSSRL